MGPRGKRPREGLVLGATVARRGVLGARKRRGGGRGRGTASTYVAPASGCAAAAAAAAALGEGSSLGRWLPGQYLDSCSASWTSAAASGRLRWA